MGKVQHGFRQVHLDFHTGPHIPDVAASFDPKEFVRVVKAAHVDSVTVFAKCHHGHLYFNTEHPARHPALPKELDLLRAQVDALHAEGIRAPIYISVLWDEFAANLHPEWLVVNPDGTLQNVMVFVKSGVEGMTFQTPSEPVIIDQKDCRYIPHVFTMMVNQPLKIKNSDATLHNIHAWAEKNTPFNIGQPVQGMETTKSFNKEEVPLPIRCDVHKWMSSYVGVFSHPFHTVTREAGSFELKLPPGKYEIVAWHEKYGTQTATVEVADGEKKEINFTFKETTTAD